MERIAIFLLSRATPAREGSDGPPRGRNLARRAAATGASGDEGDSRKGLRSGDTNISNSSEIRDRRRAVSGILVLEGSGAAALTVGPRLLGAPGAARIERPAVVREPLDFRLGPRHLHHSCSASKIAAEGGAPKVSCLGRSPIELPIKGGSPRMVCPILLRGSSRPGAPPQDTEHVGSVDLSLPPPAACEKGGLGRPAPGPTAALRPPFPSLGAPPLLGPLPPSIGLAQHRLGFLCGLLSGSPSLPRAPPLYGPHLVSLCELPSNHLGPQSPLACFPPPHACARSEFWWTREDFRSRCSCSCRLISLGCPPPSAWD